MDLNDFFQSMKFTIRYIEDPTRRSGMRNSQHSRTTNILIINQCPSIEIISDRNKAGMFHYGQRLCQPFVVSLDAGTINRTQTQHGSQWLTVGTPRIQDDPITAACRTRETASGMVMKYRFISLWVTVSGSPCFN